MMLSILKKRMSFFLIALVVAALSVVWGYAQVESVSSSDPMAMQKIAYAKMLTDGIQNLMAIVMMWLIISATSKFHVPLKAVSIFKIAVKSCFVFITGMVLFMFTAAVVANSLGFDASQMTDKKLYDIQNNYLYQITIGVAGVFALMVMWSAAFISLLAVREQVKQVSPYAKHIEKPGVVRAFFGVDSALSIRNSPHIWTLLLLAVVVKFSSWYLARFSEPVLMFIGHVIQASVYVFFVVIVEQCFIAVSNKTFSSLRESNVVANKRAS